MDMRRLLAVIVALCGLASPALAGGTFDTGPNSPAVTRPANTTAYSANSIVCATSCVASSFPIAGIQGDGIQIGTVQFVKSGSSTTNATFILHFFTQSPTMTSLSDGSAYAAPFGADIPYYLGSASCSSGTVGADNQVSYQCSFTGGQNYLAGRAWTGKVYEIIEVTGAYTPASGETFTTRVAGFYD